MMTMGLTGKVAPYKTGFGPMPAEVFHVPFPSPILGVTVEQSLAALDTLLKADVDPARVAAIIIEPVQGEGGFYQAPIELLTALRKLCDQHGILFIADEVQTGFARTGKLFAIEHAGIEPDLITVAKSLAGGFPLSGVIGKAEIMDGPAPGGLGGTYAGSPLSCAAALAVLDVIEEEHLCARANTIGAQIKQRLNSLTGKGYTCVGEVRGLGAMVALELVKDGDLSRPDPDLTKALVAKAAANGLIILSCGTRSNVIRFLVPLTASDAIVAEGLDLLERSLAEVQAPAVQAKIA
jgi:4-aminobutyrate aminotransferase/(S)-3-amino-2-methylpropionate transaminase